MSPFDFALLQLLAAGNGPTNVVTYSGMPVTYNGVQVTYNGAPFGARS